MHVLPTENHFRSKDTCRLKVKIQEKMFIINGNKNKVKVAILVSNNTDFRTKTTMRNKEGHYITIIHNQK